jgi:hypothetical protein
MRAYTLHRMAALIQGLSHLPSYTAFGCMHVSEHRRQRADAFRCIRWRGVAASTQMDRYASMCICVATDRCIQSDRYAQQRVRARTPMEPYTHASIRKCVCGSLGGWAHRCCLVCVHTATRVWSIECIHSNMYLRLAPATGALACGLPDRSGRQGQRWGQAFRFIYRFR